MNVNGRRLFITVCFFIGQNKYFGWNVFPMSDAELITDGMVYLMLALSIRNEDKPCT